MVLKTTVTATDVDEAYLRIKDVRKKHHYNMIIIFHKNIIVMFI